MTHDPHDSDLLDRLHELARVEPPFMTPVSTMIPVAVSRGRRRRIAGMASRTVAVAVPVALVGLVAFTLRPGGHLRNDLDITTLEGPPVATSPAVPTSATQASPSTSPSVPVVAPSSSPSVTAIRGCTAHDLTATAGWSSQAMNQPWTVVVIRNSSNSACRIEGYPSLVMTTTPESATTPVRPADISVVNGDTFGVRDPGRSEVTVGVHEEAWFAVGTGLAYSGPIYQVHSLSFSLPGSREQVAVPGFTQGIQGNTGDPLPVLVTAIAPGPPPTGP